MNQNTEACILNNIDAKTANCMRCPYFDCMVLVDTTSTEPDVLHQSPNYFNQCTVAYPRASLTVEVPQTQTE